MKTTLRYLSFIPPVGLLSGMLSEHWELGQKSTVAMTAVLLVVAISLFDYLSKRFFRNE